MARGSQGRFIAQSLFSTNVTVTLRSARYVSNAGVTSADALLQCHSLELLSDLEFLSLVEGKLLSNRALRVRQNIVYNEGDGKQINRFGKLQVYLDSDIVNVNGVWEPLSLDEVARRAGNGTSPSSEQYRVAL